MGLPNIRSVREKARAEIAHNERSNSRISAIQDLNDSLSIRNA